jgi:hypothetical protein
MESRFPPPSSLEPVDTSVQPRGQAKKTIHRIITKYLQRTNRCEGRFEENCSGFLPNKSVRKGAWHCAILKTKNSHDASVSIDERLMSLGANRRSQPYMRTTGPYKPRIILGIVWNIYDGDLKGRPDRNRSIIVAEMPK